LKKANCPLIQKKSFDGDEALVSEGIPESLYSALREQSSPPTNPPSDNPKLHWDHSLRSLLSWNSAF
jgi:hypothetical protein